MKKAKKKIIILLIVIAFLAALVFAAYEIAMRYAGDKATEMMISNQINSMLDAGEISLDDVIEIAAESPAPELPEEATEKEPVAPQEKDGRAKEPPAQASSVKSEEKAEPTRKEAVEKATEKINNDVATSDKREVMKLIKSRLTTEDMRTLLGFLSGGLTKKEISDAAKIAYSRFSSEEIVRVKEFWHKYKNGLQRAKE